MNKTENAPVRVLFIVGKGRSGSTILNSMLGEVPGVFGAGELRRLWDWSLRQGVRCGCGEDVLDCSLWSKVLDEGFGIRSREGDAERIQAILRDYHAVAHWHKAPRLFARRRVGGWEALRRYAATTQVLFRTIADVTGAQVVVDSSKSPLYPAVLGLVDGIDGSVVHLMRDPRAVGFSWQKIKQVHDRGEGATMPRYGPLHTSASWSLRNLTSEMIARRWPRDRVMQLRYEEFSREPRTSVGRLVELMGLPVADLPFVDEHTAVLNPNHTACGNPNRMNTGEVAIRHDNAWETQMDSRSRHIISALTWPLRHRYGYTAPEKQPA